MSTLSKFANAAGVAAVCLVSIGCEKTQEHVPQGLTAEPAAEIEGAKASFVGRWGSRPCLSDLVATLRPDGTYTEAGGHGRWRAIGNKLHLQVIVPPKIVFESMYPELLALDQDGQIEILREDSLLLHADGYTKTLYRCS